MYFLFVEWMVKLAFVLICAVDRVSELESKLQNSEQLLSRQLNEFQQK